MARQSVRKAVAVRDQFARRKLRISANIELVEKLICSHESAALHIHKNPYEIGRWTFHGRLFGALQSTILQLKIYSAYQALLPLWLNGAILFSKIVLNKLRINGITLT